MAIKLNLDTTHIMSGEAYDDFIEDLCSGIPACWDDDVAVEAIIVAYVRQIEPSARAQGTHHKQWCMGKCG